VILEFRRWLAKTKAEAATWHRWLLVEVAIRYNNRKKSRGKAPDVVEAKE
jgi:hypothetical protein